MTQWQTWTASKDVFAEVVSLDQHLQSRSYLVGTAPTLADIQVYWCVRIPTPGQCTAIAGTSTNRLSYLAPRVAGLTTSPLPALARVL